MVQASLAPCRQADIFHNQKRRRAPLSFSASSPRPSGVEWAGHKAWATPCIACRIRSCSCKSLGRRSPVEPGISSAGRPVSIPTDNTLLFDFLAELIFFKGFVQALTKYAASKSLILLCGVRQLAANVFQFNIQLGVGILKVILLLPHPCQHTLASL